MLDPVDFLRARLDEDEQVAKATLDTAARVGLLRGEEPPRWAFDAMQVRSGDGNLIVKHTWVAEGEHIARHDPARALREVEAKRKLLDSHYNYGGLCPRCFDFSNKPVQREAWPCEVVRLLALPYADHPDYQEEWQVSA